MSNKQVVETIFKAKDSISSVFRSMGRNSDRFGNGAEKAFKKASRSAKRFESITSSILKASAVQKGLGLLSNGIQSVTSDFIGFDDALFSAAAKFNDIDLSTKKGQDSFKKLGEAARKTGAATQFNATQAGEALNFLALAGFNAKQAMAALPGLADFATAAGMEDLGRAVDIVSDSLGAFGLATKNAAQLEKNLTRVSDVFAKTQASSNTTIEALFEAVAKGGPTIEATGQSLETFAALSGIMANSSLKAGEAGTQLRNVMLRLADPTKKSKRILRGLGVQLRDEKENFRDMVDIIGDFEKGLKGMGNAQRAQALSVVFGTRAITGMSILLKKGSKGLREYREGIEDSAGASKTMADIMRRSLGNRIKSLQSAATELGFKFLDAFKKNGVDGITTLTNALRNIDPKPLIAGIKEAVFIFRDMLMVTKSILMISSPLIAAIIAYKAVVISTTAAQAAMSAGVAIYQLLTNSIKLTTMAQAALNVVMSLNPIGLIIAGVVLLGGALFILVKKWDVVKSSMISGAQAILRIFTKVWDFHKNIAGIAGGIVSGIFGGDDKAGPANQAASNTPQIFAPPNKTEAQAQSQRFEGILKFDNKPDNVSFESKSIGAPLIDIAGLGSN